MARREKTITAGRMVSGVSYPIPSYRRDDSDRQRGEKRRETTFWKAKLNRLKSCDKMEQLLYCNFQSGDLYITLTYREECLPGVRKEVMNDFKYFIKQLRALRRARGQECRYIYTIEHKHGEGRWHIHLVLNGTGRGDMMEVKRCWRNGWAKVDYLTMTRGEELARYLSKERPDGVGDHPWMASRGLRRPIVESSIVPDSALPQIPPGAVVKVREQQHNQFGDFIYWKVYLTQ